MLKLNTGTRKTMANTNVFSTLKHFRHRPYSKNLLIHVPVTPHRIDIIKSFETSWIGILLTMNRTRNVRLHRMCFEFSRRQRNNNQNNSIEIKSIWPWFRPWHHQFCSSYCWCQRKHIMWNSLNFANKCSIVHHMLACCRHILPAENRILSINNWQLLNS